MKKILSVYFILSGLIAVAQQRGDITVNWQPTKAVSYGDFKITTPQFDAENFQFKGDSGQLLYLKRIPQPTGVNENSLQITNVVYGAIAASELGDLTLKSVPVAINATLRNVTARDQHKAFISFSPIIKDGGGYKKVLSLSYSFNSSAARISSGNNNFNSLSNSVLASGEWFRFYVVSSGVYYLNKAFLQSLGINANGIDPRKIKIYGNGGRMVPLSNSVFYPEDLEENAIQVTGENDGVFNDNDAVVFYAEGLDNYSTDSDTSGNLYADKAYYYINVQGNDGKRMLPMAQPTGAATQTITTYNESLFHEIDQTNIGRLGRRWYGENFDSNNQQSFGFSIPGIVTTTPIKLKVVTAAIAPIVTSFKVDANGQQVGLISIPRTGLYNVGEAGILPITTSFPASENVSIKLTYNNSGVPSAKGYLDYIQLKVERALRGNNAKQFRFQYDAAATGVGIADYQMANANGITQVWDITDIYNASTTPDNSQSILSFKANLGDLRKYIAVSPTDYYTPLRELQPRVANQNLKGTIFKDSQGNFKDIDYIIVTPSVFAPQAEKLANFHRNYSNLNVKVVTLESIYQEFCSGKQDIGAIRNFMKYVYFNASSVDRRVKYLNLFGDASFDFKNRVSLATNFVPIYHALNSLTLGESSFASDDFFTLMDDNEGNVDVNNGEPDIAVGRMIANSNIQADELVNKVIDYHDIQSYGNWRNNIVGIADDADSSSDASLQTRMNTLIDRVVVEKPFINKTKILLDAYQQQTSSGGSRYPKARQDFFNAFEKGALVFNYLGHGGEDGLAQERIFERVDGQNLNNRFKYPLFITITCQFSRFDNPYRPTAGEYTYWNPHGGAISMITTIREIGQSTGELFNDVLSKHLFAYGSTQYPSIAEALRLTKTDAAAPSTNVVFYLGDPALMLAIPQPKIRLTKINDVPITQPIDDFKALSYVKLTGEVTDENNNPLPAYTGELAVQVFDKNLTRATYNNDFNAPSINFDILGETIFRGNATVTAGQFEFGFVVPRDITIGLGNGRISFYSKRNQLLFDKTGYDTTIKVGGINANAAADNTPPKVKLYMNDLTFVNGSLTNQSPIFLAFLEDENGINTASGIGHDIQAVLDGDENNPYKLNDYYETELDNYKKGKLKFPFRNLAVGLHTLKFFAWDVYNNPITAEIQFIVAGDSSISISNVLNYPNPFVNYTQFWFTHNKPFEPLEVQVQVLTVTGKIVWTKNQTVTTDGFLSRDITWDGKDDFGDKIGKGVYIYKLTVKSVITNTKTQKIEKLVIL